MKKKKRNKPVVLRGDDVITFLYKILDKCSTEEKKELQTYINKEMKGIIEIKENQESFSINANKFIHLEIL